MRGARCAFQRKPFRCYNAQPCGHGETGRRKGLKIPRLVRAVPVRVRLPAPGALHEFGHGLRAASRRSIQGGFRPRSGTVPLSNEVIAYYDSLAGTYDADRFGGSYGEFVHQQETAILARMLPKDAQAVLDVGCGTGRLTAHATHGCGASINSLKIAAGKRPAQDFVAANLALLPFAPSSFDAAICFHVFMHLDRAVIQSGLNEIARVLKPGGILIADVASAVRRRILGQRPEGWHASTSFSVQEFSDIAAASGLRMSGVSGTILAPIHRLPRSARKPFVMLDGFLANRFPNVASYIAASFAKETT
jgi:ubiquinone/menaquinone biosynthesis C-methylase UbiE